MSSISLLIRPLVIGGLIGLLSFGSGLAVAQNGSDDFPEITNSEPGDAEPMAAAEAAATLQLPEGFQATVFAAEPEVQNPIAMAWDDRHRLWIAENFTYAERSQRFDLSMRDRVLIFEDRDGDGRADQRTVFTDQVQMLTSVEIGRGGVWLMCPPQLLFIPDADRDDIPDGPAQVMLDGFTVGQGSYHNFANGLRWGPDGWLYGRCGHSCPGNLGVPGTPASERTPINGGIWRFDPDRKVVEVLCHGTVNPWGHDWDRHGELFFINTVIGHLWHALPGSHFKESFGESPNPSVYERMDMIADHYHFDTGKNWTASRDGAANALGGGHAHVGMMIYQGNTWPELYRDRLMTINMHGKRVNVERLDRTDTGYVGRHEPDFAISEDPFFRGTDLSVGPDGQVYLIDWSDTGECHEHTGVHRQSGRIFKISYPASPDNAPPFAKPLCLAGPGELVQLWKDYQSGTTTPESLRALADHPDEHLRVWAIRLLTDHWPLDWITGPAPQSIYPDAPETLSWLQQRADQDPSGLVVRVLASTLQRLPVDQRASIAQGLISRAAHADQHDLALLTWYGLSPMGDTDPEGLVGLAQANRWPRLQRFIARHLAQLAPRNPEPLEQLLAAAGQMPLETRREIVTGMQAALRGVRRLNPPEGWATFAALPGVADQRERVRELSTLFGDGRAIAEVRKLALDPKVEIGVRQSALETLIESRPDDLREICEKLLDQRPINTIAIRGLALFDDPKIARSIAGKFHRFAPQDRPQVIQTLVARKSFARTLLDLLADGKSRISVDDLAATHARQIRSFGDPALDRQLSQVWGEISETPAARKQEITLWKGRLSEETLQRADLAAGRRLFRDQCSNCHQLYGEGQKIGPDLTGSQRTDLDYLLQNIVDPSAVVPKGYRMTTVATLDGRIFNGLLVESNDRRLILQTANEQVTIPAEDVEASRQSTESAMPVGLLKTLTQEQVRDLMGYLKHPFQVPLN